MSPTRAPGASALVGRALALAGRPPAPAGTALALGCLLAAAPALLAQDVFYADLAPGVGAKTELAGGPGFDETVIVELYFYAGSRDSSRLEIDVIRPGNRATTERVFALAPGSGTEEALVERCRVKERALLCEPLDRPAIFTALAPGDWGELLEIEIPRQGIDWGGEFLRLTMPEGAYTLAGYEDEADDGSLVVLVDEGGRPIRRPSPALEAPLPALSDLERQYLEQRPFLRFDASPLVRDQRTGEGGFEELSLSFDGGIYWQLGGGTALWQLRWSGDVATDPALNFDNLTVETGAALNLLAGDWLPLTLSARGQSDQAFDVVDLAGEARLAWVLPFNLDLQSGAYRPAAAPLVHLIGGYGVGLERPEPDATDEGDLTPEEGFLRAGYEVRWRVPLGETALLRLHHAGLWNDPAGVDGDWHALWDLSLEIALGDLTYFVGYQEGEAAPLFRPIEATRVGFSFAIREP